MEKHSCNFDEKYLDCFVEHRGQSGLPDTEPGLVIKKVEAITQFRPETVTSFVFWAKIVSSGYPMVDMGDIATL